MTKNKKGAEHVDWAISIGIFLLFLLSILVYIKPVYKPTYEAETLGEMIKNSFLAENNATIYKLPLIVSGCTSTPIGCGHTKFLINDLKTKTLLTNNLGAILAEGDYRRNANYISFGTSSNTYWLYHSDDLIPNLGGTLNPAGNECICNNKKGETTEYIGLKSSSSTYSDLKNKIKGFPESKEFRIRVIKNNGEELPVYTPSGSPIPPEDVSVYVYEFVYPLLTWESNQPTKVNYIVSIQIW